MLSMKTCIYIEQKSKRKESSLSTQYTYKKKHNRIIELRQIPSATKSISKPTILVTDTLPKLCGDMCGNYYGYFKVKLLLLTYHESDPILE